MTFEDWWKESVSEMTYNVRIECKNLASRVWEVAIASERERIVAFMRSKGEFWLSQMIVEGIHPDLKP